MGLRDRFADTDRPQWLLVGLAVCVFFGIVLAGATSTTAFGAYNPGWDGSRQFRTVTAGTGADAIVATNTSTYARVNPNDTTAIVLSPTTEYDRRSTAEVRSFVRSGGTLVVAGDFGPHANDLLAALGVETRIDGRPVRDERNYWRSPAFPIAIDVNQSAYPNVSQITLNHGSTLNVSAEAVVLVNTSGFAYVDENGNGRLDANETLGDFPVVASERVGDGRVIVVSDPSVFINSMLTRDGNRAFARALVDDSDTVLFDYSHAGGVPPLAAVVLALRESALLQVLVVALVFGIVGLWARRPLVGPVRERIQDETPDAPALSRAEMAAAVERAHPDWDEERITRVTKGITDVPTQSSDDE